MPTPFPYREFEREIAALRQQLAALQSQLDQLQIQVEAARDLWRCQAGDHAMLAANPIWQDAFVHRASAQPPSFWGKDQSQENSFRKIDELLAHLDKRSLPPAVEEELAGEVLFGASVVLAGVLYFLAISSPLLSRLARHVWWTVRGFLQ